MTEVYLTVNPDLIVKRIFLVSKKDLHHHSPGVGIKKIITSFKLSPETRCTLTRQERLKYCKTCKNKEFDFHRGLLCGLTHEEADFESVCPHYTPSDETRSLENFRQSREEEAERKKQERKAHKKQHRAERKKAKWERRKKQHRYPDKIRRDDLYLLTGIGLITLAILRLIAYSNYSYATTISTGIYSLIVYLISATSALLLRKKQPWRYHFFGDTKFKLLYAAVLTLMVFLYQQLSDAQLYIPRLPNIISLYIVIFILTMISWILVAPVNLLFRKISKHHVTAQ